MSQTQFAAMIREIESDPLFQRLFLPGPGLPRVIRRHRWASTRLHCGFYELKEEIPAQTESVDVESILEKRQSLVQTIRRIGQEAFERYFLYGDEVTSLGDIAERTGLTLHEVKKIHELILDVSVQSEFAGSASRVSSHALRYSLVAQIEVDKNSSNGILFSLTSPFLARGRYSLDRGALREWKNQKALASGEMKPLRFLLEKIELVNMRQNALLRILETVSHGQTEYLHSHKRSKLLPLTMRTLAKRLGFAASTVSRAIAGRSVLLPWGEEVPLSRLLPRIRDVLKSIVDELLADPRSQKLGDAKLAKHIEENFGLRVSRQTVNAVKREYAELAIL